MDVQENVKMRIGVSVSLSRIEEVRELAIAAARLADQHRGRGPNKKEAVIYKELSNRMKRLCPFFRNIGIAGHCGMTTVMGDGFDPRRIKMCICSSCPLITNRAQEEDQGEI